MNNNQTSKWYVDLTLFIGFIVAFFLDLTGLELHQWIGVAASGLAAYHLITHWTWVSAVTERFFAKTSPRARLHYLIDAAIFAGFLVIGLTGLVISSWLNLSLTHYDLWLQYHIQASILTLILTVVKISLHWRWVVTTTKKTFSPAGQQAQHEIPTLKPAPVAVPAAIRQPVNRRDFIKMMGIVGAASVIALGSAASGLNDASAGLSSSEAATSSAQTLSSDSFETYSSDQTCLVRCGRRCSYPGHCHRYTDTNGNNRCDFGECA
jgi:hypothetical protein